MHEMPVCRVAAAGWMAQTQGAALEGQLPIGLHLRCCSRYYYTADTKSPILNQRAAALFLNRLSDLCWVLARFEALDAKEKTGDQG